MSFNRLDYDKCAYQQKVNESQSPLDYALFKGKYENDKECNVSSDPNNMSQLNKTLVENELYNLNRSSTLCSSKKFDPNASVNVPKHSPVFLCENVYRMPSSGSSKNGNSCEK